MRTKSGAGWLCFVAAVCLCGTVLPGRGMEGAAGESAGPGAATVDSVQRRLAEVRDRLDQIDRRQGVLEEEGQGVQTQLRDAHREQYTLRQQLLESDAEALELAQRIETLQKEMHDAQEALAQRLATLPEQVETQARQTAALDRVRANQRESLELANERVQLQLEQRALEEKLAAPAADTLPEAAVGGTPPATEEAVP